MGNNSELIEPDPEVMQAIVLRVEITAQRQSGRSKRFASRSST